MSKQMITSTKNINARIHNGTHGHQYKCRNIHTGEVLMCEKLPPILKALREITNYTFKVPHGNKVRTMILEEGLCIVQNGSDIYEITIDRW